MSDHTSPGAAFVAPAPAAIFLAAADALAIVGGWLAAGCLAALVLLISAEIVVAAASRMIPSLPGGISIAWEYSAYLMGSAFLFGAALTLRAGVHIRVSLLPSRLRPGMRRLLEIATTSIGCSVTGLLAWSLITFAWRSWSSGQVSGGSFTPLWIPQAALAVGAVMFAVQMAARLVRSVLGLQLEDGALKAAGPTE